MQVTKKTKGFHSSHGGMNIPHGGRGRKWKEPVRFSLAKFLWGAAKLTRHFSLEGSASYIQLTGSGAETEVPSNEKPFKLVL